MCHTKISSCIDHILCNFDTGEAWCATYDATISDHSSTTILFPVTQVPRIKSRDTHSRISFPALRACLQSTECIYSSDSLLSDEVSTPDVNASYSKLSKCLREALMQSTTAKDKKYYRTPICPWMNWPILEQIKKNFWHSKVKMHRNNDYYLQQFRVARNKVTAMIRKRKKRILHDLDNEIFR